VSDTPKPKSPGAKLPGGRSKRPSGLSAARLLAVQALYQRSVAGQSAAEVLREFQQHRVEEEVEGLKHAAVNRGLLTELVEGVAREEGSLDDMLAAVLDEDWTIERLEILLHALLRAATFELSERLDVPARRRTTRTASPTRRATPAQSRTAPSASCGTHTRLVCPRSRACCTG
jgi:N utilization substance protein B